MGYDLTVRDIDHTTELTAIDFGSLEPEITYRFPAVETDFYYVDNVGDYDVRVSFNTTDFSGDVTLTMWIKHASLPEVDWQTLGENEIYTYKLNHYPPNNNCLWYMEITPNSGAQRGDYSSTLTWNADDAP